MNGWLDGSRGGVIKLTEFQSSEKRAKRVLNESDETC